MNQCIKGRVIGLLACAGLGSSLKLEMHLKGEPVVADAQEKYAISLGWFFDKTGPPSDVEAIAETFCPAVFSMTLAEEHAQAAMEKDGRPATPIDKLLVTNVKTLPDEFREFMTSRGVNLIGVDDDPLQRLAREHHWPNLNNLVNVLKLIPMAHPDWGYAAIQLADWDQFILEGDFLTAAAHEGQVGVFSGSMTPTNGGLFVLRPSVQLGDSLARALKHGFSYSDGWGGNYSQKDLLLAKPFSDKFCMNPWQPGKDCCRQSPRSLWCFAASHVDQGLLFHLLIDGGRNSSCPAFGSGCPRWRDMHATLYPKPWQMEQVKSKEEHGQLSLPASDSIDHYNSRIDEWWLNVGQLADGIFRNDQVCGAFFARQHELYRQWKTVNLLEFHTFQQRKPVMWVHVHKNAGTTMCRLAEDLERVVLPNDGTCNSEVLHDAFFPDGIGQKRQWTTCKDRARYFLDNQFTWGQIEREMNPGDYCPDDFVYGITLRDPLSRLESYANWNSLRVNGHEWMGYMSCIQQKNESACPTLEERTVAKVNWSYREWDNYNLRVLGGYSVMNLPPGGVNSSHLAAAIELLEHFDLVLPIENISSKLAQDEMKQVLGWSKTSHARENSHSRVLFTEDQRAAWAHVNRFDVQLYAHFAQRYQ